MGEPGAVVGGGAGRGLDVDRDGVPDLLFRRAVHPLLLGPAVVALGWPLWQRRSAPAGSQGAVCRRCTDRRLGSCGSAGFVRMGFGLAARGAAVAGAEERDRAGGDGVAEKIGGIRRSLLCSRW